MGGGEAPGRGFVTEQVEYLRPRSKERDVSLLTTPREVRVLTEKTIARMNRITAGRLRHRDELRGVQISGRL